MSADRPGVRGARRLAAVWALALAPWLVTGCDGGGGDEETDAAPRVALQGVEAFASVGDDAARSQALFVEAGRVLQHPRCLNCHPTDMHPRQGERLAMHQPPVVRGDDNHGTVAMRCETCHQQQNVDHARLPGEANWHLAPLEMGWIGLSLREICEQVKDQDRNGGMTLEALREHMAHDPLVGWAWDPGEGREPAPGTQESFGALIGAWIDAGAHCPDGPKGDAVVSADVSGSACDTCHDRDFDSP